MGLAGAAQAPRLSRQRITMRAGEVGSEETEISFGITSMTPEEAGRNRLLRQ